MKIKLNQTFKKYNMKNGDLPEADVIKSKGKHIKSLREKGKIIAQLWEYKNIQYVIPANNVVFTRDEDNGNGINAALFPYKFNSSSLFRALRSEKIRNNMRRKLTTEKTDPK